MVQSFSKQALIVGNARRGRSVHLPHISNSGPLPWTDRLQVLQYHLSDLVQCSGDAGHCVSIGAQQGWAADWGSGTVCNTVKCSKL